MTAQISDRFRYRKREYAVAGTSEQELFDPSLFGLKPAALWTLCWRGYQAVFGIVEGRLVLDTLHVNLVPPGVNLVLPGEGYRRQEGPVINGVAPISANMNFFSITPMRASITSWTTPAAYSLPKGSSTTSTSTRGSRPRGNTRGLSSCSSMPGSFSRSLIDPTKSRKHGLPLEAREALS